MYIALNDRWYGFGGMVPDVMILIRPSGLSGRSTESAGQVNAASRWALSRVSMLFGVLIGCVLMNVKFWVKICLVCTFEKYRNIECIL